MRDDYHRELTNEIHHFQPQMCYWRRLSKRSALSPNGTQTMQYPIDDELYTEVAHFNSTTHGNDKQNVKRKREGRKMIDSQRDKEQINLSDKMSLTQSLLVRPIDDPDAAAYSMQQQAAFSDQLDSNSASGQLLCYRRVEVLAFLLATGSLLLVAMSVTVACCLQQTSKLKRFRRSNYMEATNRSLCGPSSSLGSLSSANSASTAYLSNLNHLGQVGASKRPFGSALVHQPAVGRHKERLLILSLLQACVI